MPYRKRKKPHRGIGTARRGDVPDRDRTSLWALDFQFDTTVDGRTLKLLNIVDEFTRECPAIVVDRSIDADKVVATLDRLARERGAPGVRAVRQRTRVHRARGRGLVPVQRRRQRVHRSRLTMAERLDRDRFNGRLRDELLNGWQLRQPPRSPSPHRRLAHRLQHATDPTPPTATSPRPSSPKPGPHQHQPALA